MCCQPILSFIGLMTLLGIVTSTAHAQHDNPRDEIWTQKILDGLKRQLGFSDAEFAKLRPKIESVMMIQEAIGANQSLEWASNQGVAENDGVSEYGWDNVFGHNEASDFLRQDRLDKERYLGSLLFDPQRTPAKVAGAIDELRRTKMKSKDQLKRAQADLAAAATLRQEAWLTVDGLTLGSPYPENQYLTEPSGVDSETGKLMTAKVRDRLNGELETYIASGKYMEDRSGAKPFTAGECKMMGPKMLAIYRTQKMDGPVGGRQVILHLGPNDVGGAPDLPPSPLTNALNNLQHTLENPKTTDDEIKTKIEAVRRVKVMADADVAARRADLIAELKPNTEQTAWLVYWGWLE